MKKSSRGWVWLGGGILAVAVTAGVLTATFAQAEPQVLSLQGTLTGRDMTEGCTSPVGFCLLDEFTGTLNGTANAVTSSLSTTPDPGVGGADTDLVIHDTRGDLKCRAQSVFGATEGSSGEFAFLCAVTGGNGDFAGATGYILAFGDIPAGETDTQATYGGKIVLAD